MINVTDLRNGAIFLHNGAPYKVLNYSHIKVARGGATIKLKITNLLTGSIVDLSLNNGDKVEEADIQNKNMQFLYKDGESLHFMDVEDYSQVDIPLSVAEYESKFLVEGKEFQVTFFDGKPMSIMLPPSMFFKVAEAPMAVRGNTATNATKKVTLENGLVIDAPQFIKEGEVVKINTETCTYSGRGK